MPSIYARIYMTSYEAIVNHIEDQTSIKGWSINVVLGNARIAVVRLQVLNAQKLAIVLSVALEWDDESSQWAVVDITPVKNTGRVAAALPLTGRNLQTKLRALRNQVL